MLPIDKDLECVIAWSLELKLDHVQDQLGKGWTAGRRSSSSELGFDLHAYCVPIGVPELDLQVVRPVAFGSMQPELEDEG